MPIPERLKPAFASDRPPAIDRLPEARNRLIVALDVPTAAAAEDLIARLDGTCQWFKVGIELFTAAGPAIVESLAARSFSVFLDLKFHDIPNTVAGAVRSACALGVRMMTIHASGGPAMLAAARAAAAAQVAGLARPPQLLAVTVLTSMDAVQLHSTGIGLSPADQVALLAKAGLEAGIDGFVCSPQEVANLRALAGPEGVLVVPGIRPKGTDAGDQRRLATPAAALQAGASFLVVGRPIAQASNPAAAAEEIQKEMAAALVR